MSATPTDFRQPDRSIGQDGKSYPGRRELRKGGFAGLSNVFVDLRVDDHEKERVDGVDAIDPFVLERLRSKSD